MPCKKTAKARKFRMRTKSKEKKHTAYITKDTKGDIVLFTIYLKTKNNVTKDTKIWKH
jgi:hypothetical protein